MMDVPGSWQVGYYHPGDDQMVTFNIEGDNITMNPESEIFKKPDTKVEELKKDEVKIDWKEAVEMASGQMKEKYPGQDAMKTFFILQCIWEKPVYNITLLTKAFATINLKISAVDGNLEKHSLTSLTELADFQKGERS